jgi:predicted ribosome quality control (RQC) complex YloA/Tae2 family protein
MCVSVMKTAMTNFDIAAILPELRQHTIGGHIHNVYQITQKAFLLKISPGNLNLVVEPARRIHLTKFEIKTPAKPSQLCMAFRKHVRSARITSAEQPNFERVVIIEIERQGKPQKIVVELLPRGNIILIDEHDKVIVSSRYIRMKDRSILRGQPLRLPPPRGKNLLEAVPNEIQKLRSLGDIDAVKALAQMFGVGGTFAEEILQRAHVDKSSSAGNLSDNQIQGISNAIAELKDAITAGARSPVVVLENAHMIDVTPFELELYRTKQKKPYDNFNDAVDEYFTFLSSSEVGGRREVAYADKRRELERRLDAQKRQLEEITESTKTLRNTGDLIFRHLQAIRAVLQIVMNGKRSKQQLGEIRDTLLREKADGSRLYPHVRELSPPADKVTFVFEEKEIEIETRVRAQDQAAEYYAKAKRLEGKLSGLKASTEETELLLKKLASKELELRQPVEPEHRLEKEWFEKFRWFDSSGGVLVLGGRDATSNETLLKRYTSAEDLVMHAEVHGAPFMVVKTGGVQPRAETLKEAAQACVSYSRLWKEAIRSADAYWVRPEQVTKSAPTGEYLTKGAFMIRGTRNYIQGVELALAVGLTLHNDKTLLMAGPPSAVRSRCQSYVGIRQGRGSPAEAAKRILAVLAAKTKENTKAELPRITIDDVIRLLPPGGVEVVNSINP